MKKYQVEFLVHHPLFTTNEVWCVIPIASSFTTVKEARTWILTHGLPDIKYRIVSVHGNK